MNDLTTTDRLGEELRSVKDADGLDAYLSAEGTVPPYSSFIEYFRFLDETKNQTPAELYKSANIERTYFYHVWNGDKNPGRDKIIAICIAAKLDNRQVKKALEAGSQPPLYPRNTRDAVIIFAIENGFDVFATNGKLSEMGLEPLK